MAQITIIADYDQARDLTGHPDTWPETWRQRYEEDVQKAGHSARKWVSTAIERFRPGTNSAYASDTHVMVVVTLE